MVRELFIAWVLSVMTALSPPHRPHYDSAAQESFAQADERYREIAETIVDGSFASDVEPVFGGSYARQKTALLVTIWWNAESGYRRDVDLGLARTRTAKAGWNDFGRSWCMGQINLGRKRQPDPDRPGEWIEDSPTLTPEGWSGMELCRDRSKCFRTTVRVMRQSVNACKSLPASERLAAYAAGYCDSSYGKSISRTRMHHWQRWYARNKPAYTDAEALAAWTTQPTPAPAEEKLATSDGE